MGASKALIRASGKMFQEAIADNAALVNHVVETAPSITKKSLRGMKYSSLGEEIIKNSRKKKARVNKGPTKKVRAALEHSSPDSEVYQLTPISKTNQIKNTTVKKVEDAAKAAGVKEGVEEGKGLVDLAIEHPHVSTAVGALTLGGIILGMTSNKGQRSNAQLYGSPY